MLNAHAARSRHVEPEPSTQLLLVVLMGLICRQTHGVVEMGWESVALLVLYVCGTAPIAIGG